MVDDAKGLRAHFQDQGRVDAILLTCDGAAAFIDGGYRANGVRCVKYMQKLGITKLKVYIGTHGHKNHIGGAGAVIAAMKPDRVHVNRMETKDAIIRHAQPGGEREMAKSVAFTLLRPGDTVALGGARITCLGPLKIKHYTSGAVAENHNSLILRVDYADRSLLLTGDTSAGILENIDAGNKGCIKAEVLKNPHHNGAQPLSLLKKIAPGVVVVCNSAQPSEAYRKRVKSAGALLRVTCGGDVLLRAADSGWNVQ